MPCAPTRIATFACLATLFACSSARKVEPTLAPAPDVPPESVTVVRGSVAAAGAITNEDQTSIVSHVLRAFYYPVDRQARWLDPRPLAHVRTLAADDTVGADPDFADDVVASAKNARICVLGGRDFGCRGKAGGVVRFSWPYRIGKDSAVVYATYSPRDSLGKTSAPKPEMWFRLVWNPDGYWDMKDKSTVTGLSGSQPAASSTPPAPRSRP